MPQAIWRDTDLTQIRALVHEHNALDQERQALRQAAQTLHETLNIYWLGDCDKATVIRAQSRLVNILLSSPLPPRLPHIRKDGYPMTGQDAQALVQAGIERLIGDPAQWLQWAQTQARFHHYSPQNILLILAQRPDATRVAGFQTWKRLGRFVRRGEKALTIQAPMLRKSSDAVEPTEEPTRKLVGFRPVTVFDIVQTDGDPLEDPPRAIVLTGDTWQPVLTGLIASTVPVPVTFGALPPDTWGMWQPALDGQITISDAAAPNMQLKTLLHEWAHSVGIPAGTTIPLDAAARAEEEVIAETTAYIVGHTIGLNTISYSQSYVAGWSGRSPDTVRRALGAIHHRVRVMIDAIADSPDPLVQSLAPDWRGGASPVRHVS
jgi:antirestriction protein ArdC